MSINATSGLNNKLFFPFVAPPNGGKGTQTRIISQRYNLPTFDMGATFRAILKDDQNSELAKEIKSFMDQGKLVPVQTVIKVFKKGIEDLAAKHPSVKGFILDGFPRNKDQATELMTLCQQWGAKVAKVIYLQVPMDVVERRATGRRFCSKDASHVYNINDPRFTPKTKGKDEHGNEVWLCDEDQAPLITRKDDEPETVKKRLTEYNQETDPMIDTFRQQGVLASINGDQNPDQVTAEIEKVIQPALNLTPTA